MFDELNDVTEKVRRHPRLVIADDYDLVVERQLSHSNRFHNGKPAGSTQEDNIWVGLRIVHRKRPGRSYCAQLTKESIDGLVARAFSSAQSSSPDPWFRIPLLRRIPNEKASPVEGEFNPPYIQSLYDSLETPPKVLDERYEYSTRATKLMQKNAHLLLQANHTTYSLRFSVLNRCPSGEFVWLDEFRAEPTDPSEKGDWLRNLSTLSHQSTRGESSRSGSFHDVVMSPSVSCLMLEKVAPWFYADRVIEGESPLSHLQGEVRGKTPLFSPCLSLVDNGAYPERPGSSPFDLEGTPTQKTFLVKQGKFESFLYDTYSGTRENRLSTGNLLRPFASRFPAVGYSTLTIVPSSLSPESLVEEMEQGIWLCGVESFKMDSQNSTRVVLHCSGWIVSERRVMQPVHGFPLEFNLTELFSSAIAVGNDLSFFGSLGSPSILFRNIPL